MIDETIRLAVEQDYDAFRYLFRQVSRHGDDRAALARFQLNDTVAGAEVTSLMD